MRTPERRRIMEGLSGFARQESLSEFDSKAGPVAPSTLDKRLVHKAQEENVLLSHVEELARNEMEIDADGRSIRKDRFKGLLYIQKNHRFFFEHARDHVPGLYLIEAGRQLAVAVAHLFYAVPFGVEFVMTDIQVCFRNMANIFDPLTIEIAMSRHAYRKEQLTGVHSLGLVRQGDVEVGQMSGSMILMNKNLLKRLERRGGKG
jgi:hypothetical protein